MINIDFNTILPNDITLNLKEMATLILYTNLIE